MYYVIHKHIPYFLRLHIHLHYLHPYQIFLIFHFFVFVAKIMIFNTIIEIIGICSNFECLTGLNRLLPAYICTHDLRYWRKLTANWNILGETESHSVHSSILAVTPLKTLQSIHFSPPTDAGKLSY
jgi:hypothetical protein